MKNKGNYFFLGIAIAYIVVAIIQWKIPGVLGAWVYLTVAKISLWISLLEILKTTLDYMVKTKKAYINVAEDKCIEIEKDLSVTEKELKSEDVIHKKQEKANIANVIKTIEQSKEIRIMEKIYSTLSAFQIVIGVVVIALMPLKKIPYDIATTKMINIASLLTFSSMFISYFIASIGNDIDKRVREKYLVKN